MRTDPDLAGLLITHALKGGADMAEVWQRISRSISAEAREGTADAVVLSSTFGYSLRVVRNGRLGFSYSNSMDDPEHTVNTALSMTQITESDEFLILPVPEPAISTPEILDPAIADVSEQDAIRAACVIERTARDADARIRKVRKCSASFVSSNTLIMNSNGLSCEYASSLCSGSSMVVAEDGGNSQMGWGYESRRFLDDISFENVGSEAAQRAVWMLHGRKIDAVKAPVFMDSSVVVEFLSLFASMLSSESVQKGKSLLKGKAGQQVLSGAIDIIDDGLLPRGPGSRVFDDEGVPSQRTSLIDKGILQGFIYNTRNARHDGVRSTGNAVKGGISTVPGVGVSNLILTSPLAEKPSSEVLRGMRRGLYVIEVMGMHTANPVSGHFSVGVSGLWIEQGEIAYPVKETVISGNLLELFRNVEAAGNDVRFFGNIGAPGLLFGDTDISA